MKLDVFPLCLNWNEQTPVAVSLHGSPSAFTFHVITLRSMVQFIGRESKYCGLCDSIVTIYREEGIVGFFAGLIPRLLGDIISLWLCNSLAYLW